MAPHHLQTLPRGGADPLAKYAYGAALAEARGRTLSLVAPVSERNLNRQHHPLMSPLVWDLGHIAAFEDLWLCRSAGDLELLRPELSDVYDAAETPRAGRGEIPYLRREDALMFMQQVHERALIVLEAADISAGRRPAQCRRLRLGDADPARASAQRDHAPDAAARRSGRVLADARTSPAGSRESDPG